jgi:hypothetical protein
MGFRKPFDENAWHWRSDCPHWPRTNYGEIDTIHSVFNPATDVFCPACRSMETVSRPIAYVAAAAHYGSAE